MNEQTTLLMAIFVTLALLVFLAIGLSASQQNPYWHCSQIFHNSAVGSTIFQNCTFYNNSGVRP